MKNLTTVLANAPWLDPRDPTRYGVRAGSRWPHFQKVRQPGQMPNYIPFPHYLAQAASMAGRAGFTAILIDAVAEGTGPDAFCARVQAAAPGLVLMEVSTPSMGWDLELASRLKRAIPGLRVAFCGPHAPMYRPDFLAANAQVDFVLAGEYEQTFVDLLEALESGLPSLENVAGLVWRAAGGPEANAHRGLIEDLDGLPPYPYESLPMDRYNDRPCGLPGPSLQVWSSRGCPFQCVFCQWPQIMYGGRRYRMRSPVRVVDEIARVLPRYGLKSVYFDDDTFNVRRDRTLEFARLMRERLPGVPWAAMARADLMDEALLGELAGSGLFSVKYGVESADQGILDDCRKGLDLERAEAMIRCTRAHGIRVQLTFTFGFPRDSAETLRRTMDFACRMEPDYVQFSVLTPFPGTALYEDLRARGYLVDGDFSRYDGAGGAVIRTDFLGPDELEGGVREAYRRFFEARKAGRP